jgi:hypothetical protein
MPATGKTAIRTGFEAWDMTVSDLAALSGDALKKRYFHDMRGLLKSSFPGAWLFVAGR